MSQKAKVFVACLNDKWKLAFRRRSLWSLCFPAQRDWALEVQYRDIARILLEYAKLPGLLHKADVSQWLDLEHEQFRFLDVFAEPALKTLCADL